MISPAIRLSDEIEAAVEHASQIHQDMLAVVDKVGEISDNIQQLEHSLLSMSETVLKGTGKLAQETGRAQGFVSGAQTMGVGLAVAGSVAVAAKAVQFVGGKYTTYKKNKVLKEQLLIKQEIAREKMPLISKVFPRLEKLDDKLRAILFRDAGMLVDFDDFERFILVEATLDKLYTACLQIHVSRAIAEYMTREFECWLKGEHESGALIPDKGDLYFNYCYTFLGQSIMPPYSGRYEAVDNLTFGVAYLLRHRKVGVDAVLEDPDLHSLARTLSSARTRSKFLPFGKRKRFAQKFDLLFKDSGVFSYIDTHHGGEREGLIVMCAAGLFILIIVLIGLLS